MNSVFKKKVLLLAEDFSGIFTETMHDFCIDKTAEKIYNTK